MPATAPCHEEFLVACLCAAWCGTCREYQPGFEAMAADFPDVAFRWLDIEAEGDLLADYDVENFPTLLIQRDDLVLFYGVMLPQHSHLRRLLETFMEQTLEESQTYAHKTDERRVWQELSLRPLLNA
ncbi:MAG TPA: thioredoxin family protein [Rhodocyclaceae bacterium]|nr:thioredoxin family protein [Rhodocyclaceae bacterium]